ncbi:MAG: ribokinase [Rhodoferax sp.]
MILVAGSANLDYVVRASHIPAPGETTLGLGFSTHPGGKGANQALACASAGGVATTFVGVMGSDEQSVPIEASLREGGVHLALRRSHQWRTGTAFICVADSGENAITVVPGANQALAVEDLPALQGVTHLLMQLETPLDTVLAMARSARQAGVAVVLNAAPANPGCAPCLPCVDVLVVNEGELAQLSAQPASIAARMQALPVPTVVTTLGARGCVAKTPGGWVVQEAFPIEPVDTTAAGDTFCGAFAAQCAQGADTAPALRFASAAAALACTRAGAQSSIPGHGEVLAFMQRYPADEPARQALRLHCGL